MYGKPDRRQNSTARILRWNLQFCFIYCKLPKICPSFSHYLQAKVGSLLEYYILSNAYAPFLCFKQSLIHVRSTITTTAAAFWKNGSFAEPVLLKSAALVLIPNQKALKHLAFCSGDRGQSCVSSCSQCNQLKNLPVASKQGYNISLFAICPMYRFIADRAKPKLSKKNMPIRCSIRNKSQCWYHLQTSGC